MLTSADMVGLVDALGLLERSIGYTRGSLALVDSDAGADCLRSPTPCRAWDLEALLRHMDDALAAFTDAAEIGYVDPVPVPAADVASELVGRLRDRACAVLGAWTNHPRPGPLFVGDRAMPSTLLACTGALEISVHGWDVARACGHDRPLPVPLAVDLLSVAPLLVDDADRPGRFAGPVDVPPSAGAGDRLLAFLGRQP
jgi:uncharacterized protein (TIGR03086 family)